jgi:hypothetical protein
MELPRKLRPKFPDEVEACIKRVVVADLSCAGSKAALGAGMVNIAQQYAAGIPL